MKKNIIRVRKAFTLTEVMVAASISMLALVTLASVMIAVTRSLNDSQCKSDLDLYLRSTTSTLSTSVGTADYIFLFPAADMSSAANNVPLGMNGCGDYLVAVYYKNPGKFISTAPFTPGSAKPDYTIERIVGVARIPGATGSFDAAPLYYFDSLKNNWGIDFPATSTEPAGSIIKLLPTVDQIKKTTLIAATVAPSGTNSGVFIMNNVGTGVTMRALATATKGAAAVTNSYSYSISSRGMWP